MDKDIVPFVDLTMQEVQRSVSGQLAKSSRNLYASDMHAFDKWLTLEKYTLEEMTEDRLVDYRTFLIGKYARSTATRMLTVARRVMNEAFHRGLIATNPTGRVKGFTLDNESPRTALTEMQCKAMLRAIDRTMPRGKRDYALLSLMMRTGIRRAEVVALLVSSLGMDQGYYIITISHGKGDKRRIAKLQPDLYIAIQDYLITRNDVSPDDPLFVGILKTGEWKKTPLHMYGGLNYILKECAKAIDVDLTPHDLRATFATLALEGGAALHKVQYAMGHKDPRTTQRYNRRKENLADNAADYIHLGDERQGA